MYLRKILRSVPCKPPPLSAKLLPLTGLVEEEHTPHYKPQHFYPVRLYEIHNNRYQVAAKIGWGTSSTLWLALDLHQWRWRPPRYVAITVNANNYASQESAERELRIAEHITKANPQHSGRNYLATLLESFRVASQGSPHIWNTMPLDVMKPVSKFIVEGLLYLHTECHVIHTDLKSDNILLALNDPSILDSVAQDEMNDPSPRKQPDSQEIYLSRNYRGLSPDHLGDRQGDIGHRKCVSGAIGATVLIYGTRELCFAIWSMATDPSGPVSADETHLGQIISLLGPLLLIFSTGEEKHLGILTLKDKFPELIGKKDLLSMAKKIDDDDELRQFIDLISRMLRWRPEDRATAQDLISHPWLSQIGPANR